MINIITDKKKEVSDLKDYTTYLVIRIDDKDIKGILLVDKLLERFPFRVIFQDYNKDLFIDIYDDENELEQEWKVLEEVLDHNIKISVTLGDE